MIVPFVNQHLNVFDMDVLECTPCFKIKELPKYDNCYWVESNKAPKNVIVKFSVYNKQQYFQKVGNNQASVIVYIHEVLTQSPEMMNQYIESMLPYLFTYGTRIKVEK